MWQCYYVQASAAFSDDVLPAVAAVEPKYRCETYLFAAASVCAPSGAAPRPGFAVDYRALGAQSAEREWKMRLQQLARVPKT